MRPTKLLIGLAAALALSFPALAGTPVTIVDPSNTKQASIDGSNNLNVNCVVGCSGGGGSNTNVNVAQVNAHTVTEGAGATGNGSQRVTVAQDTTTVAGSAPGTAGTPSANVFTVQGAASMTPVQIAVAPSSSSSIGITPVISASAENNHVLKNAAGNLYSVYATNLTGTAGFLVVLNATSVPADGAITPLACVALPPNGTASLNISPGPPEVYSTGITAVVTSANTCFTKTTGTITAFFSGAVQ